MREVAEVEALLRAHKQTVAQQVVEYTRGRQGSVEDTLNDAIPFLAAVLAPVCAAPSNGAPTYAELVEALQAGVNRRYGEVALAEWVGTARALLSRIPKGEGDAG